MDAQACPSGSDGNRDAMQETQVQSLDLEDPLEKKMATHSSILAWKNPKGGGAWQAIQSTGSQSRT